LAKLGTPSIEKPTAPYLRTIGKVRTIGGSDNTTRRTEENHRTGEMGGEWVRAAGCVGRCSV
jgi:hypothetical protein